MVEESELELAPLPKLRVHQIVRHFGCKADITGCWWDGETWRYEVYIRRGKKRGYWVTTEETLCNGAA